MTDRVRGLIFNRPSATIHTTTWRQVVRVYTHLFPSILPPRLAFRPRAEVRNILHDTTHSPAEQHVVFLPSVLLSKPTHVVHCDHDEQLGLSWRVVEPLSKRVLVILSSARILAVKTHHKVVWIASDCCISHLGVLCVVPNRTLVEQH